ncbi:5-(carboxyamino)imidazole ribonucleotide mutase [bacterium]|nr:5-(carboxyamino)imidazole ribonucleotide mutase [bacterium]
MTNRTGPKVLVLMGSTSDMPVMEKAGPFLDYFGITYDMQVISAHRNAAKLDAVVAAAESDGYDVIIAGAGMAAALPGVVAAKTILPVIGVPLEGSALNGVDALYSIVQMPPGIPVATVAIGSAGAKNSAVLAAHIMGASYPEIREKLRTFREQGAKL